MSVLPFPVPPQTPQEATLHLLRTNAEVRDRIACNLFAHETGLWSADARTAWAALSADERMEWEARMMERHVRESAMSPAGRAMATRAAWKRTLDINDRKYESLLRRPEAS